MTTFTRRKKRFNLSKRRFIYLYDLLRELVSREMKLLYKRSALGVVWTLINPLLQLAVFSFVFRAVLPVNVANYSSFAFSGLLVWTWFQNSLFQSTGLITGNRSLIRQPNFPIAILPIATVMTGLVHFILALPVLLVFLFIDGVQPTLALSLLPILLGLQFLLTLSLAYPLAALNVTFRDTQHTLGVLLQMFFYLTPIFYDLSSVPKEFFGFYSLNPMVSLIEAYRSILLKGLVPEWQSLSLMAIAIVLILPIGYQVFRRQSRCFVEEL